jgi:hypothetical protein
MYASRMVLKAPHCMSKARDRSPPSGAISCGPPRCTEGNGRVYQCGTAGPYAKRCNITDFELRNVNDTNDFYFAWGCSSQNAPAQIAQSPK